MLTVCFFAATLLRCNLEKPTKKMILHIELFRHGRDLVVEILFGYQVYVSRCNRNNSEMLCLSTKLPPALLETMKQRKTFSDFSHRSYREHTVEGSSHRFVKAKMYLLMPAKSSSCSHRNGVLVKWIQRITSAQLS